jgi:hypothetical protein
MVKVSVSIERSVFTSFDRFLASVRPLNVLGGANGLLLQLFLRLQYLGIILLLLNCMIPRGSHGVLFACSIALKSASESQFLTTCWLFRLKIAGARLVLLKVSYSHLSLFGHDTVGSLLHLVRLAEHDLWLTDHGLLFNANLLGCVIKPFL